MTPIEAASILRAYDANPNPDRPAALVAAFASYEHDRQVARVLDGVHWYDCGDLGEWATDGACMVRKGFPVPSEREPAETDFAIWRDQYTAEQIRYQVAFQTMLQAEPVATLIYRQRMEPLWLGASRQSSRGGPHDPLVVWRLVEDREVPTAIIMPCNFSGVPAVRS